MKDRNLPVKMLHALQWVGKILQCTFVQESITVKAETSKFPPRCGQLTRKVHYSSVGR
jgi:hypothetical protein